MDGNTESKQTPGSSDDHDDSMTAPTDAATISVFSDTQAMCTTAARAPGAHEGGSEVATAEPIVINISEHSAPEQARPIRSSYTDAKGGNFSINKHSTNESDSLVKKKHNDTEAQSPEPVVQDTTSSSFRCNMNDKVNVLIIFLCLATIVILAIVLPIVLSKEPVVEEPPPPPLNVDFTTGVSLITSYAVKTMVQSRLARTTITMEVKNGLDCSSVHAVSFQLPVGTRITSLKTVTEDDCVAKGDVQELKEARETFMEAASQGLPGAYVEARQDSFTHSLQVAIPPLGTSNVELVVEQLLKQRLDEVKFEVPLFPNEGEFFLGTDMYICHK